MTKQRIGFDPDNSTRISDLVHAMKILKRSPVLKITSNAPINSTVHNSLLDLEDRVFKLSILLFTTVQMLGVHDKSIRANIYDCINAVVEKYQSKGDEMNEDEERKLECLKEILETFDPASS